MAAVVAVVAAVVVVVVNANFEEFVAVVDTFVVVPLGLMELIFVP